MNRSINVAFFCLMVFAMLAFILPSSCYAEKSSYGMPSVINTSAKYLFFFHNYYVETKGTDGDCKYYDILKAFKDKGFTVISEIRPPKVSVIEYSKKAAGDIKTIFDAGVASENITVAGHSKGAVIVIQVASLLENPEINYVILAGCGIAPLEKAYPDYSKLKGNFLSVYAISDTIAGSCATFFPNAGKEVAFKEITLDSPAGHQLFFNPAGMWFEPVIEWLSHN